MMEKSGSVFLKAFHFLYKFKQYYGCSVQKLFLMWNTPVGVCMQGIYFSPSEKNQSQSTLFFALLKIIWRPGFGLYSHHPAL
jgi:hypothetical protein